MASRQRPGFHHFPPMSRQVSMAISPLRNQPAAKPTIKARAMGRARFHIVSRYSHFEWQQTGQSGACLKRQLLVGGRPSGFRQRPGDSFPEAISTNWALASFQTGRASSPIWGEESNRDLVASRPLPLAIRGFIGFSHATARRNLQPVNGRRLLQTKSGPTLDGGCDAKALSYAFNLKGCISMFPALPPSQTLAMSKILAFPECQ